MIAERLKMWVSRLLPSRCSDESDKLRRSVELHAISAKAVRVEAMKTEKRVEDMKIVADAAERRAIERGIVTAVEDALQLPSFTGRRGGN